jgi:hypothetical protein
MSEPEISAELENEYTKVCAELATLTNPMCKFFLTGPLDRDGWPRLHQLIPLGRCKEVPPMSPHDFLLHVYCLVDDALQTLDPGRRRGPQPTLSDSEVITMERAGEFWGFDSDQALVRHFRAYHCAEFPALAQVHRTTFARQAANLWHLKQQLQRRLAAALAGADPVWLVDSLPIDACEFARAKFCARFAGEADYGHCHLRRRTFYGFRLHLRTTRDGVILDYELAPARASEKAVLSERPLPAGSIGIGDRGYWSPPLRAQLADADVALQTPYVRKQGDPDPAQARKLASVRYRIETVNSQLAERYGIKQTWARDLWHLCHRVIRKILSHTVAIVLTARAGHRPLQFDALAA